LLYIQNSPRLRTRSGRREAVRQTRKANYTPISLQPQKIYDGSQRRENALRRERDFAEITAAALDKFDKLHKLLHKHKKEAPSQLTTLEIGNKELRSPDEVREGWATHFGNLATPANKEDWDAKYYEHTCLEIEFIQNLCHFYKTAECGTQELIISREDVRKSVKRLNTGKSPDYYGITAEHLKFAGEGIIPEVTHLLNCLLRLRRIPDIMKIGVVTPIFKKKKDKSLPTNYRGITVTPVILKLIETVLRNFMLP
jgi:hypothetical protein